MSLAKYEIRNSSVLDLLEEFRYTYRELYQPEKTNRILVESMVGMADHYTGDEEMHRIVMMGRDHLGAAENSVCHPSRKSFMKGRIPKSMRRRGLS